MGFIVILSLVIAFLLLTNHPGVAIRFSNILFIFFVVLAVSSLFTSSHDK